MDIRPIDSRADGRRTGGGRRAARRAAIGVGRRPARQSARRARRARRRPRHRARMRHLLLPALQALQARVGWISEGGLGYVCDRLNVPPADAWGVATFYALLATSPRPKRVVHVCDDIACKCRGADELIAALEPQSDTRIASTRGSGLARHDRDRAPSGCGRRAWACAIRRRRRSSPIAGEQPREHLLGHVTAERICRRLVARRSQTGAPPARRRFASRWPSCICCAASAASIRPASTRTARPAASPRSTRRARWAPRR